jgi:hypothetical protein
MDSVKAKNTLKPADVYCQLVPHDLPCLLPQVRISVRYTDLSFYLPTLSS